MEKNVKNTNNTNASNNNHKKRCWNWRTSISNNKNLLFDEIRIFWTIKLDPFSKARWNRRKKNKTTVQRKPKYAFYYLIFGRSMVTHRECVYAMHWCTRVHKAITKDDHDDDDDNDDNHQNYKVETMMFGPKISGQPNDCFSFELILQKFTQMIFSISLLQISRISLD